MSKISKESKAQKVLNDVNKKIEAWNERSCFTLKGVRNLSRSDMDSLIMYAKAVIQYGNYNCYMEPRGEIRNVLEAYGLAPRLAGDD